MERNSTKSAKVGRGKMVNQELINSKQNEVETIKPKKQPHNKYS